MSGKDLIRQMRELLAQEGDPDVRGLPNDELEARLEQRAAQLTGEGDGSAPSGRTEGGSPLFAHLSNDEVKARLRAANVRATGSPITPALWRSYERPPESRGGAQDRREGEPEGNQKGQGLLDQKGED